MEEVTRQLADANDSKSKLTHQHNESTKRLMQLEHEVQQLSLNNKKLTQELDDAKMTLETELMVKTTLEQKNKNLQADLDALGGQLEEEAEIKLDLQKQVNRLQEEFRTNKEKIEKECGGKLDEYEEFKLVLNDYYHNYFVFFSSRFIFRLPIYRHF